MSRPRAGGRSGGLLPRLAPRRESSHDRGRKPLPILDRPRCEAGTTAPDRDGPRGAVPAHPTPPAEGIDVSQAIWLALPAYNEERSLPALLTRCIPVAQELERRGRRRRPRSRPGAGPD